MSSRTDNRSWSEWFSDVKKLIIEAFGTPLWISDLSAMADEVRDRTILVKINYQMHSVSNLGINYVFYEIGLVKDVRSLPIENGFHSQVRYRTKYDRDWAYHFYNGKILHQGCCELEIHRPNDVIRWNDQRVTEFKAAYVDNETLVVVSERNLPEERLKKSDGLRQIEESIEIMVEDEQNMEKEPSYTVASQVFEEMPNLENCIEHKLEAALSKDIDVVNKGEFDPKAQELMLTRKQDNSEGVKCDEHKDDIVSLGSNEDRDNLKVFMVDGSKDMMPCFDTEGELIYVCDPLKLKHVLLENNNLSFTDEGLTEMINVPRVATFGCILNQSTMLALECEIASNQVVKDSCAGMLACEDGNSVEISPPKPKSLNDMIETVRTMIFYPRGGGAYMIFDPGGYNLQLGTRTDALMLRSSRCLGFPLVMDYDENKKLRFAKCLYFGLQLLVFDPGIILVEERKSVAGIVCVSDAHMFSLQFYVAQKCIGELIRSELD